MKNNSVARFKSNDTIYTPHGLGVAYSNTNLTDKAARYILANGPDALSLFAELPGEADEEEQGLSPAQESAEKAVGKADAPVQAAPAGFDYAKLASAMLDEMERRNAAETQDEQPVFTPATEAPALTASTGGAAEAGQESDKTNSKADKSDNDQEEDAKPVSLSRANKEQLQGFCRTELDQEPAAKLSNDDLRKAIAEKRASQQDPE